MLVHIPTGRHLRPVLGNDGKARLAVRKPGNDWKRDENHVPIALSDIADLIRSRKGHLSLVPDDARGDGDRRIYSARNLRMA